MLIKGIMTTMSGSVGGVTGSHNKGGMYLRARAPVTNPNTQAQQRAREDFAIAIAEWGLLTPGQRLAWNDFGTVQEHTNRIGDSIQLSGQQAFIMLNSALRSAGLDEVAAPPEPNTKPDPYPLHAAVGFAAEPGDTGGEVTGITDGGELAGADKYVVAVGPPIGPGLTYFGGPYRITQVIDGNATASVISEKLYDAIVARYGAAPPEGSRFPIQVRAIRADGQFSAFSRRITAPTL